MFEAIRKAAPPRLYVASVEDNEILGKDIGEGIVEESKIFSFLKQKGYCIVAKTLRSVIYRKNHRDMVGMKKISCS